jgi:hypothetical protein
LRDFRSGDVRHFDPKLYDILEDLTISMGHLGVEIDIVCGYRSPWTNEFLRAHTLGVAKNSLHIQAEAIDLRIPGVDTLKQRRAALALRRGGVGYYPDPDSFMWTQAVSGSGVLIVAQAFNPAISPDTDCPSPKLFRVPRHGCRCHCKNEREPSQSSTDRPF